MRENYARNAEAKILSGLVEQSTVFASKSISMEAGEYRHNIVEDITF